MKLRDVLILTLLVLNALIALSTPVSSPGAALATHSAVGWSLAATLWFLRSVGDG
jgi:hypothetical protein